MTTRGTPWRTGLGIDLGLWMSDPTPPATPICTAARFTR